jgi:tetratricopeptide (TPR) repeat protein
MAARVTRLQEIEPIDVAGVHWRPVRRTLGVSAFGTNAYSADAGERLIERHDESQGGAGGHEEMYVVVAGRATFTVAGEEIDAPAGTVVFVPEPADVREAFAAEDGTLALAVGGPGGAAGPVSAWEFTFAGQPHAARGDWEAAYATAAEGLELHPDNASLHYNLGCFAARAGRRDDALAHLRTAFAANPKTREWAVDDEDLAELRKDPDYPR